MDNIKLHNNFLVTIEKEDGTIFSANAFNLVTNYGIDKILSGSGYSSTIALGGGTGTPSVSNSKLFSQLGSYSASKTIDFDDSTHTSTTTLKVTLDENTLANTDITEIGIGSGSSMYTHAMFTDAAGQNITIHKGALERMTVTAIAYITYIPENSSDIESKTRDRVINDIVNAYRGIASGLRGKYALVLKSNSNVILPFPANCSTRSSGSYNSNTKKAIVSSSLSSKDLLGAINCYIAEVKEATNKHNGSDGSKNIGAWPLNTELFKSEMSPIETIGVGDGLNAEFMLPYKNPYPYGNKIYIDNDLVNEADYSYELVDMSTYSPQSYNEASNMYLYDNSYKRFIILESRTCESTNINSTSWASEKDLLYYIVEINEDGTLKSVEPKLFSTGYDYLESSPESGWYSQSHIIIKPPYALYKERTRWNMYYIAEDKTKVKLFSGGTYDSVDIQNLVVDQYNSNIMYYNNTKYIINPDTLEFITEPAQANIFKGSTTSSVNRLALKNNIVELHEIIDSTSTKIRRIQIGVGELEPTVVQHYTIPTSNNRFIDFESNIIVTVKYGYINVYIFTDNTFSTLATPAISISIGGYESNAYYAIVKHDTCKYYVRHRPASGNEGKELIIDLEALTASCTVLPNVEYVGYSHSSIFKEHYFGATPNIINKWQFLGTNKYKVNRVPDKYKVVFKNPPLDGAQVKMAYDMQCIDKNADWQLTASFEYGYSNQ